MFEVGKRYIIHHLEDGNEMDSFNCKVLEYDEEKGLLKITQGSTYKIFNVQSRNFVSAILMDN